MVLSSGTDQLPVVKGPSGWEEIVTSSSLCGGKVDVINFDFYNGAMSTDQCRRLQAQIEGAAQNRHSHVVVLLGGDSFFSNGECYTQFP